MGTNSLHFRNTGLAASAYSIPDADQGNITWSARVSAADTVTVTLANPTGTAVDPGSCDWKATVYK